MSEWRKPGNVLPRTARPVPESIMRPDYANSGTPRAVDLRPSWMIEVKSKKDIEMMRAAGRCAREVLDATGRAVKPGVTTDELDAVAHAATIERGAYPSPLNYHGFPKSICTSVNEVICHGIPDDIPLKEGDVVNVDITVYLNGYHGDCSEMFYVGEVDDKSVKLVEATYDCWQAAIEACKPGVNYKQLGGIIEESIQGTGYKSVQQFCGHGIGKLFHTNPNVLHYKNSEPNGVMAVGHTFTIEPDDLRRDDTIEPVGRRLDRGDEGWGPERAVRAHALNYGGRRRGVDGEDRSSPLQRGRKVGGLEG